MKTQLSRRLSYPAGSTPAWLSRLCHFLSDRYGTPEGYGICFYLGTEQWGSTWRCRDRARMISLDHVQRGERVETLLTVRRCAP